MSLGEIFRSVATHAENVKPVAIPLEIDQNLVALTSDNNIVYYEEGKEEVGLWSIIGQKILLSESVAGRIVSRVYVKQNNKYYFIGYKDGVLEVRNSTNFIKEYDIIGLGEIIDIVSDE
mmetsp:Transcript_39909/g.38459  ORF Transcript_39909/g.38459 Transcript_39909/m.38459 type:complete len:119 (+) Transcript_39909:146-502(+)